MPGRVLRHLFALTVLLVASLAASRVEAGCGCRKAPPPAAAVRPAFASPGDEVTLFGGGLVAGKSYKVRFERGSRDETVSGTAVRKRDLADGVTKTLLEVKVPWAMRPGPTRIRVSRDGNVVQRIEPSQFTVMQAPLHLQEADGVTVAKCYAAAVGADGTVYFPLRIGAISKQMVFSGIAEKYPLLFDADDVTIYNTQGFLMQLLAPGQEGSLYTIGDPGSPDSLELTYDRHEFVTYKEQHVHEGSLALDPSDPSWHVDGTPHVDHDEIVVAIAGRLERGGVPRSGSTPPFDFSIATALSDGSTPAVTRTIRWSWDCSDDDDDDDD
jgi:hypothetical protein